MEKEERIKIVENKKNMFFAYNPAGNRIADNTKTYYYNNLNQLLYTSDGTNYSYDANGNLIQKTKGTETTKYTWDTFDKLREIELPDGKKIKFVYGADGLRREKIEEGGRVNYLLDGLVVLAEFDDSLSLLREFVPGVSVCIGSESFYYHYDRLGSVRFISDSGGSVVCDYVYDAFGNILSSSGNLNQPYEYVGREGYYREEFDLYLLGVRWYDSEVGRFISRDPIGEKGGINLYEYAENRPINYLDITGFISVNSNCESYINVPLLEKALQFIYNNLINCDEVDLRIKECLLQKWSRIKVICSKCHGKGVNCGKANPATETVIICKEELISEICPSILYTISHELIHLCGMIHGEKMETLTNALIKCPCK